MSKIRQRKVANQIARVLGQLLIAEARDERFSMVTVNEVEISPDLNYAKVYVAVQLPKTSSSVAEVREEGVDDGAEEAEDTTTNDSDTNELDANEIVKALNHASPWFQRGLSKEIRLRKTPRISFIFDSAADKYAEIDALLKKVL